MALQPERWQEEIVRRSFSDYLLLQRGSDRELARILQDAANEAARLARSIPGEGIGAQVRRAQMAQVSLALRQNQNKLWNRINGAIAQRLRDATEVALKANRRINEFLARAAAPDLEASFLAAADRSALNVQSRVLNDIDLSPRVYKNKELSSGRIAQIANRGVALNKSAREIARDVRGFIDPNVRGGVSYAAFRLGRTELNNAFHTTSRRAYAEQPWVAGVKWNLSKSHPRKDECNEYAEEDRHGIGSGVFKRGAVPGKPHPQCLCYITPITVDQESFLDNLMSGDYDSFLNQLGYGGMR